LLIDAAGMGYPGDQQVVAMLEPLNKALARVEAAKQAASHSVLSKHCALAAGAMTALWWIISADPPRHIRDTLNAVPTYGAELEVCVYG
jgi:hypothetical protein